MTDILQAARSYYGLADAKVRKTEWFTDEGKMILCFEIVTEGEDFIGIVERMKALQQEMDIHLADGAGESLDGGAANRARIYDEYVKSASYGISRKVAHIDAPETEEPTTMDAVWLSETDTTEAQRKFASDMLMTQHDIQYLVPWPMLTEEQRQKAKEKL